MQADQFKLHAEIETQHWWFVARRQIMRRLIERVLPPDETTTIVDVGCGTGGNIAALADAYRCVGIDTSPDAVRRAQERFPQVEFFTGFAPHDLGEIAGQARLFLLMDVLEHVPDDFELLSSLLAAAEPGTHFLLTVPADMCLWSEHDVSFGHYRRYTAERLQQAWNRLPVTPRLVSYYNSRLYPLVRTVRTWNRWRGSASGAAGTDFSLPPAPLNRLLTRTFAGEASRLLACCDTSRRPYSRGVSLVALLRREAGEIATRQRPDGIAADYFNPVTGQLVAS